MGIFGAILKLFRKRNATELSMNQMVDLCMKNKLTREDIVHTRTINVLDAALVLMESDHMDDATRLVGYLIQNNPNVVTGNFLLNHPELKVPETSLFKNMLETESERDIFYKLYRNNLITDASVGKIDDRTKEKMNLAFQEGIMRESKQTSENLSLHNSDMNITNNDREIMTDDAHDEYMFEEFEI